MDRYALGLAQVVLLAGCVASPAHAQDQFADSERASRTSTFENRPAFGGLSQIAWPSQHWSANTFFIVYRGQYPDQTSYWVIRRVTGSPNIEPAVVWADSRHCPAVEQTLIAMEQLPAIRPDASKIGEEAANIGLVLDGTHHVFWNRWARYGERDANVGLEVSGNVNSPIAEWWSANVANLESCWRDEPPT